VIPLAVVEQLGEQVLAHTARQTWRLSTSIGGTADVERLAERLQARQLWFHPSWSRAHPVELPAWSTVLTSSGYVQVCAPFGDKLGAGAIADTADGRELLGVLLVLDAELGTWWRGTAGATGSAVLRQALRIRGLLEPPSTPPPAMSRAGGELDFGWLRPLIAAERSRRWLHSFDKHAMYLVAAGTVELGAGPCELELSPVFHARTAAYWHTLTREWPTDRLIPDPTHARAVRASAVPSYRWLTTPSVEAALAAGIVEHIDAAWQWPKHGRYLQPTAEALRIVRQHFEQRHDAVGRIGLQLVKPMYTAMLGRLAWSNLPKTDPLYRPDWYAMVRAEARCRLWYQVRALDAAGCPPVAVGTDAVFIASDSIDPHQVTRGILEFGPAPRQWAHVGYVPLGEIADRFDRPRPATRMMRRFRELHDG
jgi:hypothetical protein